MQTGSSSFDLLHEKVRRWIWRQGWDSLRDIQERSIPHLLDGDRDLIISAGTASGKTEAAFLPIVSRIASEDRTSGQGFDAIYVSPLRALINDQFSRLDALCEELEIPVVRWHGDVGAAAKARARIKPAGIVLITPESLEAILVRKGPEVARLFRGLAYMVIDEMHAFIGEPRGKQLQSLMHRIETASGNRVIRVGLSATLADEGVSREFLRPLDPDSVTILPSSGSQDIRLQVRGYLEPTPSKAKPLPEDVDDTTEQADQAAGNVAESQIVRHLFDTLRGKRSLIFAGSRQRVETTALGLKELTEVNVVPEEFFAHHGSLSRERREEAEERMKDVRFPASIVCTTTLEMGIDVGAIDSVAQLGAGHTVSGMRQRLGRSGRRPGASSTMRVYVKERPLEQADHPFDMMRRDTFQAVAMLGLMLEKWNEPPVPGRLHLSTLVHQILALIAQHGGITAAQGWVWLMESQVFDAVSRDLYVKVLRSMGRPDVELIEQAADGTLLPGRVGETILAGRDIYAVFSSGDDLRVVEHGGRTVGTVPGTNPYVVGQLLILAGRRWKVVDIDVRRREIVVVRSGGGRPPIFGGDAVPPSEGVVKRMRDLYAGESVPSYLDEVAIQLLGEGRETFERLGLRSSSIVMHQGRLLVMPWVGGRTLNALSLSLMESGVSSIQLGLGLELRSDAAGGLRAALEKLCDRVSDPVALARLVPDKTVDKFDHVLGEELQCLMYGRERLDTAGLPDLAKNLLDGWKAVSTQHPGAPSVLCPAVRHEDLTLPVTLADDPDGAGVNIDVA